jgi:nucleotide-binding universal stress UspA family protein
MKKIIAAIDGLKFSESTMNYAIQLAKKSNAQLVGVFLDDYSYHSYKIYELVHGDEEVTEERVEAFENADKMSRNIAAANFKSACEEESINYSIHHDRNIAIHELLHESIYADMVIIDAKETLTHYEENLPTRFIRDVLANVECPVLVVPNAFKEIRKIVLLYDGEPSSVFAIKMFSYMFPDMENMDTEIISVKTNEKAIQSPDNRLMK